MAVATSDLRCRKWSKQVKTVGHLTLRKWVPDQEKPTEALQSRANRKSKGRKRGAVEMGRMTRSVRQHLDAPLELLSEPPPKNMKTPPSSSPPTKSDGQAYKTPTSAPSSSPDTSRQPTPEPAKPEPSTQTTSAPKENASSSMGIDERMLEQQMLNNTDEQLEMVLDDLPMLDTEEGVPFGSS